MSMVSHMSLVAITLSTSPWPPCYLMASWLETAHGGVGVGLVCDATHPARDSGHTIVRAESAEELANNMSNKQCGVPGRSVAIKLAKTKYTPRICHTLSSSMFGAVCPVL